MRCALESVRSLLLVPIERLREADPELESFMNLNSREDAEKLSRILRPAPDGSNPDRAAGYGGRRSSS